MKNKAFLLSYAELVLRIGVNLQKDQGLEVSCPIEKSEYAEAFTIKAYELGAKIVKIRWQNETIDKLNYKNASVDALIEVPKWFVQSKNYLVEKGFCYVAISAEDPSAFKNIPVEKLALVSKARSKALKKFSDSVMQNAIRWCVVSVPTRAWAKQVFPKAKNPQELLLRAIISTMRLDTNNPVNEWQQHILRLERRAEYLNNKNYTALRFTNKNGTDLTVGLATNHVWLSAKERAKDGVSFVANMPTEEVFTAPHKDNINGKVYSAMPLIYNGQKIDEFSLTFKNGKVVNFSAKEGYETLKHLIETDKGTLSLGEVALIGKNSPIAKSGILFYNTLFDENASCHLALGKAYPTTVKNGDNLSVKELKELGLNDSVEHVDFMIGTPDLYVEGVLNDGKLEPIFVDGDWVI